MKPGNIMAATLRAGMRGADCTSPDVALRPRHTAHRVTHWKLIDFGTAIAARQDQDRAAPVSRTLHTWPAGLPLRSTTRAAQNK